ncbi:EAL domain-containing protein [Dyella sp. A6]|uniref:bifunctional diguanylate cyclase/phosphodiesterase n=1 Tax=Dyella aluminiiresistens TaxID=3069105 RepID=UPI002E771A84|nr:EAL domain-containing protein [Dyella sp. A6]
MRRLVGTTTVEAVDDLLVSYALEQAGCVSAALVRPQRTDSGWSVAGCAIPAGAHQVVVDLMQHGQNRESSADARHQAFRMGADGSLVMAMSFSSPPADVELEQSILPCLELAEQHLQQVRMLVDLHASHRQLARSESLQRALFTISDLSGSELDMPEMLRGIHDILRSLMYAENFYIVRCDPRQSTLHFLYYADTVDETSPVIGQEMAMDAIQGSLTWHLITRGKPLMGSAEEIIAQLGGSLKALGPESADWLGVPMLRDGVVHGALVVQSYRQGIRFSDEDSTLLMFVGSHILTALERKQSKHELEQHVRERTSELARLNLGLRQEVQERQRAVRLQESLFQLARLATSDLDEDSFYQRVHAVVRKLLNAENFFISLLSSDRRSLELPYFVDKGVRHRMTRPLGRGLSEYVLRRGEAWLGTRDDINALQRSGEVVPHRIGAPSMSWLGVPLRFEDEVIGLVAVQSYEQGASYGAADKNLLSFVALQIAHSINRRRSAAALQEANIRLEHRVEERTRELRAEISRRERIQQQLRHQVMHDPLTALPNRGYLRDRLERLLAVLKSEPGRCCALLYIDVDRFKMINDSLGHLAGDEFLKVVAERLRYCVRDPDVVARLSGDEFAILLEDIGPHRNVEEVASRVLQVMNQSMQIAGREIEPSVSMGIAVGDGHYGHADELVRDADIALYRAKELGRRRYVVFDQTLARSAQDVFTLEGELRHALQRDEFEPYFQPIRRLADGRLMGYEALLRWNHPYRGMLAPNDFLRVAQDTGHLESIDWRLFKRAFQSFGKMTSSGLFLSINVSPRHLRNADFDRRLLGLLERAGFPGAAHLVVEVTEGALLESAGKVQATLGRLHDAGIDAALDDFGTGYSSLSYLHTLPLRKLKIDQSFVQALGEQVPDNSSMVVAAILALGRALNVVVIAEGIETETQRRMLLEMGCEYGQGYLLGRPAPAEAWSVKAGQPA